MKYKEFWCPYCKGWINDTIHRQDHHIDGDEPDPIREDRWRTSDDGENWKYHDEEPA